MGGPESGVKRHDGGSWIEQLLELQRVGIVMSPDSTRPEEAWGVLNPACARSRDGELYLFPRVVAEGNHSRIGIARVIVDAGGRPSSVERLGYVLEPKESYELGGDGLGGVEDPRITYIPLIDQYVMTYVALGPDRPHIALAVSSDLQSWDRLGLVSFESTDGFDFNPCDNKDCVIFPLPVHDSQGRPAFAILHRPTYQRVDVDGSTRWILPPGVKDRRQSMWISYAPLDRVRENIQDLTHVSNHQLLAQPLGGWENHHIGAGAPPLLTEEGWLLYYHGVFGSSPPGIRLPDDVMVYQSGIMLLDGIDPRRVYFRSSRPVLVPQLESERQGVVANVVFPTAVDVRGRRIDVYYGAADLCIAAATTEIGRPVLMAPSAPPRRETPARQTQPTVRWESVARDREVGGKVSMKQSHGTGGGAAVLVKDVMTPTVEVIGPTTTLEEAAARMRALNIGMLPVRAGNDLVGVITDRDMAVRAMAQGLDPKAAEVGGVMTPGVVSCFDDQSVEEAASIMATYRVRRLVVIDGAMRPMGIISLDDVAAGAENPALAGQTLIRTSARPDRVYGYRRILVALDGSKFAERILPSILPLADKFESTVTLVQAVAPVEAPALAEVPLAAGSDGWGAAGASPLADEMRAHAESYLASVQQELEARGLRVEMVCPEGEASEVILAQARRIAADLIAITTHGRTGVDRMLFGSVAEEVLRRAPCPVLLVRVQDGL